MYGPRAMCSFMRMGRRAALSRRCGHGTSGTHDVSEGWLSLGMNRVATIKWKAHGCYI